MTDFLDFLSTLPDTDKVILLNSLGNDYSKDELANMLIPVFLSFSDTEAGKTALEILGNSKSQLAYHALNCALEFVPENIVPSIKKNFSVLLVIIEMFVLCIMNLIILTVVICS